jgi:hypothetical protein
MWRTSSWIEIDGLIVGYRQRHPNQLVSHLHVPGTRTAAAHTTAA